MNVQTAKDICSFYVDEAQLSFFEKKEPNKETHHTRKEKRVLEKIKELDILGYDTNASDEYSL